MTIVFCSNAPVSPHKGLIYGLKLCKLNLDIPEKLLHYLGNFTDNFAQAFLLCL
jgi:hypothetical protein